MGDVENYNNRSFIVSVLKLHPRVRREIVKLTKLILLCTMVAGIIGCGSGSTKTVGRREVTRKGQLSKVELRDELERFEDFFVSTMTQTADEIDDTHETRRIRREGQQMRTRIIESLFAMTASDDSVVAFLDTWGLVIRLRIYLERGAGSHLYGKDQPDIVNFIKLAEKEIAHIGQLFLKPDQFEDAQRGLEEFARQHPITGIYSNLVVYATHEEPEEAGALMRTLSIPMAPIRAMEGVDNTATSIHNVSNSVEQFSDIVQQLPRSARWQMTILMDDFEESEMTQSFLKSVEDFSKSSTHLVEVLDAMPQQVRSELLTVLEESDQSQQQLQTTLQTAAEAAGRVEKMFAQLNTTSQALNITTQQASDAAVAWKNASDSIQELVSMFKGKPRDPDAPPGFGMRDFDNLLLNAGQTADKVGNAVAQFQQTVDAAAKEEMQKQLRSLIDHVMWRLFELVLAVVILVVGGLYLIKRLQASKAVKNE
jgi:hypothetical protein